MIDGAEVELPATLNSQFALTAKYASNPCESGDLRNARFPRLCGTLGKKLLLVAASNRFKSQFRPSLTLGDDFVDSNGNAIRYGANFVASDVAADGIT